MTDASAPDVPALAIRGLVKSFPGKAAVAGLDLTIPRGEFHALLGPNGAGKTTTLRIVAGLLKPDAGDVRVLGHDIGHDGAGAKRVMAFVPDEPQLYGKLNPMEYLEFVAGLWGMDPARAGPLAEDLLRFLDLDGNATDRIETFSRGMRQKLALAGALVHDPELMILDEPLTGIDAAAARQIKDLLLARVKGGRTVLLTTHVLEIAERLAQRISIVHDGRILAQGTLDELRARASAGDESATLEDVFLKLTANA